MRMSSPGSHYSAVKGMITAIKAVKAMRGRSSAMHMEADNGWHYVVKPPMIGRRALINEWLGARLYQMLGLMVADVRPIRIPFALARTCWAHAPQGDVIGVASAFPVEPAKQAIYDFLPPSMFDRVANLDHLVGALAVDLWAGKSEARHCVYFRQGPWWACFIDHKAMFGGTRWDCVGMANPRNPAAKSAYHHYLTDAEIQMWAKEILSIRPAVLYRLVKEVPDFWLDHDTSLDLSGLAELLLSRRNQIPAMLRSMAGESDPPKASWCGIMSVNAPCSPM